MSIKQSRFNFVYPRGEGERVIYNTFSKALVCLDDDEFSQYESLSFSDKELLSALVDNLILVDERLDEQAYLKYVHYKSKLQSKTLWLTIAPTLDCNFACPYCYENRRHGSMSEDVAGALIVWLEEQLSQGIRHLDVTWYGGEPLMYPKIVFSFAERIRSLCSSNKVDLSMHMVTNGYLLSDEVIERLDEVGVTRLQITLDGLASHHNERRPLRDGRGTFDRICENLRRFADSPIEVVVRMNVDNENACDYLELKEMIDGLENQNITLYASPVEDINPDTVNNVSKFMTEEEFDAFSLDACEKGGLSEDDFSVMDNRFCFCTAETEHCWVVDDLGDFYKCWDEVGRKEYCCFNVMDPGEIDYANVVRYTASDPFGDAKCSECVFLPLCFGGCKFQRSMLGHPVCGFTREKLSAYLEMAYF